MLKSKINFHYSLLDIPEFFWENPEYDKVYTRCSEYLEINQRTEILNKKMTIIDEIMDALTDELNHRHSAKLEWIIIILISVEIIIFVSHDLLNLV